MVQIIVNEGFSFSSTRSLDLSALFTAELSQRSATALQFAASATNQYRLEGVGFTYDGANHPSDGTVNAIELSISGQVAYRLTGAALDIGDLLTVDGTQLASTARARLLAGDDEFRGASGTDIFFGNSGHDVIMGGAGEDALQGGDGNDHIYGQSPNGGVDGADEIDGGAGNDYINGNAGDDGLYGGLGNDRIFGGAGNDFIYGGAGNDTVNGNLGNDTIYGSGGIDSLRGGQGNDVIYGSDVGSILMGDAGNDTLSGSAGTMLTGGTGADVFSVGHVSIVPVKDPSLMSIVTDFTDGEDKLSFAFKPGVVLTGTASSYEAAYQAAQLLMIANEAVKEVVAIQVGSDSYLFHSLNGLRDIPEVSAMLTGVQASTIDVSDFVG